jgi:hypothetical protein
MHPIDHSLKRLCPPLLIDQPDETETKVLRVSPQLLSTKAPILSANRDTPVGGGGVFDVHCRGGGGESNPKKVGHVFFRKPGGGLKLEIPSTPLSAELPVTEPHFRLKKGGGLSISLDLVANAVDMPLGLEKSAVCVNRLLGPIFPQIAEWSEKVCAIFEKDFEASGRVRPSFVTSNQGACGSYFVLDDQEKIVAVVKPGDEEPGAIHGRGDYQLLKEGIEPMSASCREVLAYRLAPEIVPPTVMMELTSRQFVQEATKRCSVQMFIENSGSMHSVEKRKRKDFLCYLEPTIFIDLWFCNSDRHSRNLLVQTKGETIEGVVPIDHGCILPNNLVTGALFFWYPLIDPAQKFGFSTQEKINSIDLENVRREVSDLQLGDRVFHAIAATTLLLKKMHKTHSMRQIAMYYIEEPENWENKKSILFYILRMAAVKAGRDFVSPDSGFSQIPLPILSDTLEEVVDFIEGQREILDTQLQSTGLDKESALTFLEKRYTNPDQKIHLALEITRDFFQKRFKAYDGLNPTQRDLSEGDSLFKAQWQNEAGTAIHEAFQQRLEHPELEFEQPEELW